MALLRSDYLEHLRGVVRFALLDPKGDRVFNALLRGAAAYVRAGSPGPVRAERLDAVERLVTMANTVRGLPHDDHVLLHAQLAAGVPPTDARAIPNTPEPTP